MKLLHEKKYQLLIILLLTTLPYLAIFQNQFVIDDSAFISESYGGHLSFGSALSGAVPAGHEGVYRPIRSLLYVIYYQLFGTNPVGYHLHALLVHVLCTVLVYLISVRVIGEVRKVGEVRDWVPFLTALLFGLHPIHTESIVYVSSAMDTIGIVFALGGFYFYLKQRKLLSLILIMLGFFTNEVTLTLPILIVLHEFLFKKHTSFYKTWVYFAGIICYFLVRFALHISTRGGYPSNNFLMGIGLIPNQIFEFSKMVVLPYPLMHNHILGKGMESVLYRGNMVDSSRIISWESLVGVGILVSLVGLGIYFWKRNPLVSFSLGWFLITLTPALTIVPQGTLFHERFLYVPSFGFCLLAAYVLSKFQNTKHKEAGLVALFFVYCFYSYVTFTRILDWKDPAALWTKDIILSPQKNAYGYFKRGESEAENNPEQAVTDYEKAFQINPHFAVAIASAALVYQKQNDENKAEESYKKAVAADPYFWEGWFNLGNIYFQRNELEMSENAYYQASTINPDFIRAKQNLEEVLRLQRTRYQ